MAHVRRKAAFYEARGERVEVLDAAALREAEPQLRPGLRARCACRATASSTRRRPRASSSSGPGLGAPRSWPGLRVEAIEPGRARCAAAAGARPTSS